MKASHSEFWGPLIEKAYAKLYGSYGAIEGGWTTEAMIDFTGGIFERFYLKPEPEKLFNIINNAKQKRSLIGADISKEYVGFINKRSKGLVAGHAYSVTKAVIIDSPCQSLKVVRVKNPWNNEVEWNGPFGDNSPEWRQVPEDVRKSMKVQFDSDGEFFMLYPDFLKYFDVVEICHISPNIIVDEIRDFKWIESTYDGRWTSGEGNEQIIVQLVDPDEDDDEDHCTMIVALMQKNRRKMRADDCPISFDVYKLASHDLAKPFLEDGLLGRRKLPKSPKFESYREICSRYSFKPGAYAIIPRIKSSAGGEFLLRIFTEAPRNGLSKSSVIVKVNKPGKVLAGEHETILQILDIQEHRATSAAPETVTPRFSCKIVAMMSFAVLFVAFMVAASFLLFSQKFILQK